MSVGTRASTSPEASVAIIGAGGSGREAFSILEAMRLAGEPLRALGFIDDGAVDAEALARLGAPLLGGSEVLEQLPPSTRYVVGVSSPTVRRRLVARAEAAGLTAATLIHPTAVLGMDVEIGAGSVVWPGASLTTNIRVGAHCHVNNAVTVGHDTRIAAFVTLNPQAAVSGAVTIEEGALVGGAACILQGQTVGRDAVIGAGAVVVRRVASSVTVVGVPAGPLERA